MNGRNDIRLLPWLLLIVITGIAILIVLTGLSGSIPMLGRLPGDTYLILPRGAIFLPITSGLLISVLVTLLLTALTKESTNDTP